MLKNLIDALSLKLGYKILPVWRFDLYNQTELLSRLIETHKINLVIDVGANTGQFASYLRTHVGYKNRIISFEPISDNYKKIVKLTENDSFWSVFCYALGAEETNKSFNIMKEDQFSSFLHPTTKNIDSFVDNNIIDRTETISLRKLDNVLNELDLINSKSNIYLKLDTQGYDLEVIKGAQNSLSRISILQTELSVINIYDDMPKMNYVIDKLRDIGFEIAGLFPISTDKNYRVIEFDGIFVNKSFNLL